MLLFEVMTSIAIMLLICAKPRRYAEGFASVLTLRQEKVASNRAG
jgi:hypothetical protein